jgi:hypothetical protein
MVVDCDELHEVEPVVGSADAVAAENTSGAATSAVATAPIRTFVRNLKIDIPEAYY